MKSKLTAIISNPKYIFILYFLFSVLASVQSLNGKKTYDESGIEYNKYNNYTIFEKSFVHLKNNQDLYILHPTEHWDLYKYTPSFSVFFGIFSSLPDWLGLNLWNLMNSLVLLFAVYYLPKLSNLQKGLVLLVVLFELLTSMQNEQSNALISGLLVFSFGFLERKKIFLATFCIVFSVFIKLFGLVGFAIFLFYPQKGKAFVYTLFWSLFFLVLPLLFVDFQQYQTIYTSFFTMLKEDHDMSLGYSVMGWLNVWFGIVINKSWIVGLGALVFLIPFVQLKKYNDFVFKYLILCSVLIWIVIFNHKAESPTFIIAMTGVGMWFILSEKNYLNVSLFVFAFLFTSLSPTDLFPRSLRENFVNPYVLKAVPCIFIWFKVIYDLVFSKKGSAELPIHEQIG